MQSYDKYFKYASFYAKYPIKYIIFCFFFNFHLTNLHNSNIFCIFVVAFGKSCFRMPLCVIKRMIASALPKTTLPFFWGPHIV